MGMFSCLPGGRALGVEENQPEYRAHFCVWLEDSGGWGAEEPAEHEKCAGGSVFFCVQLQGRPGVVGKGKGSGDLIHEKCACYSTFFVFRGVECGGMAGGVSRRIYGFNKKKKNSFMGMGTTAHSHSGPHPASPLCVVVSWGHVIASIAPGWHGGGQLPLRLDVDGWWKEVNDTWQSHGIHEQSYVTHFIALIYNQYKQSIILYILLNPLLIYILNEHRVL